jgi:hypothetical protein
MFIPLGNSVCINYAHFVHYQVQVPPSFMLDDVLSRRSIGTGVIIYCAQDMGLVAVDKNTVAVLSSEVMLTFAAFPVQIPGQVKKLS